MTVASMFDVVPEVPLSDPPIVRALIQLRFGPVLSIRNDDYIAGFQERIRTSYPQAAKAQTVQLLLGPEGVTQQAGESMWQFSGEDGWTLTLAAGFLAVDTTRYTARRELVERFRNAVDALTTLVGASTSWSRLGARYVNRLEGADFERLDEFVTAEAAGARAFPMPPHVRVVNSLNEVHYSTGPDSGLVARWGIVPAQVSVIPDVPPVDGPSWILDADSFIDRIGHRLDCGSLAEMASERCEETYRVFRWAVTDSLLRTRGGTL